MTLTPNDPNFPGYTDCDEALFLARTIDGVQAVCECHLTDCDEESHSGYAWDFTTYVFKSGHWEDWDGGRYWDYADARELASEFPLPMSWMSGGFELRLAPDHGLFGELLEAERMFSAEEFDACQPVR